MFNLIGSNENPKGPNLKKSKRINCNFSGVEFSFLCPPSNHSYADPKDVALGDGFKLNLYSSDDYLGEEDDVSYVGLAAERYKYSNGLLAGRCVGGIDFSVVLQWVHGQGNLLKPLEYEAWLDKAMRDDHGPFGDPKLWLYQFPLFWNVKRLEGSPDLQWVSYAAQNLDSEDGDQLEYYLRAAISPEHELVFKFRTLTDHYDSGAFLLFKKIVDHIQKSIEVRLTNSIKNELNEAAIDGGKFSQSKPIVRYDDVDRSDYAEYELLDDPNLYFTRLGKTVDRIL